MRKIAILTGGYEAERIIAIRSAAVVAKHLDSSKYEIYTIELSEEGWFEQSTHAVVDRNDFSIIVKGHKILFDAVFMCIHGAPVENGQIQGYFELLGIPYTGCNGLVSGILMNKSLSKNLAKALYGANVARCIEVIKGSDIPIESIKSLGLPVFVKPNSVGSSFGVSKVKHWDELPKALEEAFAHDTLALVEEFIEGREFSNGVFEHNGKLLTLPVTEIIPENEFFDFDAKYNGKSKEITPADLSPELTKKCQELSLNLFEGFGCNGFSRIDYILKNNEFYFIEVNTLPGLSEQSILPQQLNHSGISLSQAFEILIENLF